VKVRRRKTFNRARRGGSGRKDIREKGNQDTQATCGSKKEYDNIRKSLSDYVYNAVQENRQMSLL
jgi:hypothetical protein